MLTTSPARIIELQGWNDLYVRIDRNLFRSMKRSVIRMNVDFEIKKKERKNKATYLSSISLIVNFSVENYFSERIESILFKVTRCDVSPSVGKKKICELLFPALLK